MDILTFLGLDYRVALLIILYFVVPGIRTAKRMFRSHKKHTKDSETKRLYRFKVEQISYGVASPLKSGLRYKRPLKITFKSLLC